MRAHREWATTGDNRIRLLLSFGGLLRMLMRLNGVLVRLLGKLMRGKVVPLVVRGGGSFVGVGGKIMKLGGLGVRTLWHLDFLSVLFR